MTRPTVKAVAHDAGERGSSCYRYLRQREIRESVCGRVFKNPVAELDPRMSRESATVSTNADPDAMPNDAVRIEHSAESYRTCETERAKNPIACGPANSGRQAVAGMRLGAVQTRRSGIIAGRDLHELTQRAEPPYGLRAQQCELRFTNVANVIPPSGAQGANSRTDSSHAADFVLVRSTRPARSRSSKRVIISARICSSVASGKRSRINEHNWSMLSPDCGSNSHAEAATAFIP